MAAVSLENWTERIRDPKIECMSGMKWRHYRANVW